MIDKTTLSMMDLFLMASFFFCILTGFFTIIPQPKILAAFWLVVSFVSYLPMFYLPFHLKRADSIIQPTNNNEETEVFLQISHRFAQRYNIAVFLATVLPLHGLNYLIALFGGFDAIQTIVGYQLLSMVTKCLFAAATMDIHRDALHHAQRALLVEQQANETRRYFYKNILHEVSALPFTILMFLHNSY